MKLTETQEHNQKQATSSFLKEYSIRPTVQRIAIYDYINSMKNHPTIEMVYTAIQPEFPTLSKTTIYNTLKKFVKAGIIQPLTIEENEMRFDADISPHIHFKCTQCESITDFFIPDNRKSISSFIPESYQVNEEHMYIHGICRTCSRPV